jgi:hypothetical protein
VLGERCRLVANADDRDAARRGGILDGESLDQKVLPD